MVLEKVHLGLLAQKYVQREGLIHDVQCHQGRKMKKWLKNVCACLSLEESSSPEQSILLISS